MGPDNPVAGLAQAGQLKEETPVMKGMLALEKSQAYLSEVLVRHTGKLRPILTPVGPQESTTEGKDPQPPYSDLANAIMQRAQAIYALARQLEELSSRVEL